MANVFTVLDHDHRQVEGMLDQLTGTTGALSDAQRKELADKLVIEESKHEAAEETHLWPVVRQRVAGGEGLVDKAVEQENEAKKVLQQIDHAGAEDPGLLRLLGEFAAAGRAHIAFEEQKIWPGLGEVLSEAEANELGRTIEEAKGSAPTRPHPHTPA